MPPTRPYGLIALVALLVLGMGYWAYPRLQDGMPRLRPVSSTLSPPPSSDSSEPKRIFSWPNRPAAPPKKVDRALILFTYAESEASRQNLLFFVKHGLHGAADFVFVFNGDTDAPTLVPSRRNIKIVKRNSTCFDLGASGQVLREKDLWKGYAKFILMNASLRGPFLPYWTDSCWSDLFLSKVTDKVKLVGITANCSPRFYLPSMILATDKVGMGLLLDPKAALAASTPDIYGGADDPVGLSGCYDSWKKAVHAEIGMTSVILNGGYGVDVMMSGFHRGVDHKAYCDKTQGVGDVLNPDRYFGSNVHPYETVFINPNRGITPVLVDNLGTWMAEDGYSSEDRCRAQKHK
ncbi:hypothetical protein QIS74_04828 [Colletotrichum tabaci]|uniref:Uncharacterized protein n=1 Tax=Colletotrichum tabaci TaxID=1209068 RepID=A0AAV9THK6_9PEZI